VRLFLPDKSLRHTYHGSQYKSNVERLRRSVAADLCQSARTQWRCGGLVVCARVVDACKHATAQPALRLQTGKRLDYGEPNCKSLVGAASVGSGHRRSGGVDPAGYGIEQRAPSTVPSKAGLHLEQQWQLRLESASTKHARGPFGRITHGSQRIVGGADIGTGAGKRPCWTTGLGEEHARITAESNRMVLSAKERDKSEAFGAGYAWRLRSGSSANDRVGPSVDHAIVLERWWFWRRVGKK